MKTDDGIRSRVGLIVCLRSVSDVTTRLVFDDAKSDTPKRPAKWKPRTLFTWNEYDSKRLNEMKLSKREYAEIGENLVMRLLALNGNLK